MPDVPTSGMPSRVPVAALNARPAGKAPDRLKTGFEIPTASTRKLLGLLTRNVATLALVIPCGTTLMLNRSVVGEPLPLVAVIVSGYVPRSRVVPLKRPVESSVRPLGKAPE